MWERINQSLFGMVYFEMNQKAEKAWFEVEKKRILQ